MLRSWPNTISCAVRKAISPDGPTERARSASSNLKQHNKIMQNGSRQIHNGSRQRTKQKALIVCSESPYPAVVGGYERLIEDYQQHFFTDYDVYFLDCRRDKLNKLHHYGAPVNNGHARRRILAEDFAFALFVHSDFDFNGQTL